MINLQAQMQNAILYQAYGGMDFINECRYSLLKYLQVYNLAPPAATGIYIYTDQPHYFSDFLPFFRKLECIEVTKETVTNWKGPFQFVHRFKIEMIRNFLHRFNGNVLYCDTDTYLTKPLETVFQNISENELYMHQYEGVIDSAKFPSFHKWEKFLSTTSIAYNNKQLQFNHTIQMFNAGVVGLTAAHKDLLNDVLDLTDALYQKFPKHIAEQFAFSYCFQKTAAIKTAESCIAHYWNLKEFRQLLASFFLKNGEESIPNLVKKVHHLDALPIMFDKMVYEKLSPLLRFWKKIAGAAWKIDRYEKKI